MTTEEHQMIDGLQAAIPPMQVWVVEAVDEESIAPGEVIGVFRTPQGARHSCQQREDRLLQWQSGKDEFDRARGKVANYTVWSTQVRP